MSFTRRINRTAASIPKIDTESITALEAINGYISINGGAAAGVTLPALLDLQAALGAANTDGLQLVIRRTSTGLATLTAGVGTTVDGGVSTTLPVIYDVALLILQGTDWKIS